MIILIISFYSTTPLRVWRRLPYIIKDESGEEVEDFTAA